MLFKTYLNARIFYYCSNKNVKAQILWIYDNASNLKYTFTFYYLQTSIDFLTFSLTLDKPQRLLTTFRMPIHINLDVMLVMPPTTKDLPNHLSTYTVNITTALYAFVVYVINSQFIALKPSINIPLRPLIYIYIFVHPFPVRPQDLQVRMKNKTYLATENDTMVHIECEVLPSDAHVEWLWQGSPLECWNEYRNSTEAITFSPSDGFEVIFTFLSRLFANLVYIYVSITVLFMTAFSSFL